MMSAKYCPLLLGMSALCGVLLVPISHGLGEERIGRTREGTMVPPDTEAHRFLEPTGEPGETTGRRAPKGPLKITITEAILLCLEKNRSLVVERFKPSIQQTFEDQERAVFDPTVHIEVSAGREKQEPVTTSGSETEGNTTDTADGVISLKQYFPTGTTVTLEASAHINDSSLDDASSYSSRLGMTVTQALLRGFGIDANLARLRQAQLDTRMSEYELRGFTEGLVAELEGTYWDYALAGRQMEIVKESLKVARQQLKETKELIAVGRLAKAELAAVQAEVAAQEQAMIEARAKKESIRLQLLRLLNPSESGIWQREVVLIHRPTLPKIKLEDVELHVAVSMRMRPILNEARLKILHGDLELVRTRNGLLPFMELFIRLGKSGYAHSFGQSIGNMKEDSYDALLGLRFEYPIINRDAKALHRRAQVTREQAEKALENLSQLVEVDIRTAYIEVNRTKEQIVASSVTRKFDEEKLRIETEKLRVGKSTSFLVAQAHRDLLVSRMAEVQAIANYLKALIDLYRQDGSLLERRGISAPGREPVRLSKK